MYRLLQRKYSNTTVHDLGLINYEGYRASKRYVDHRMRLSSEVNNLFLNIEKTCKDLNDMHVIHNRIVNSIHSDGNLLQTCKDTAIIYSVIFHKLNNMLDFSNDGVYTYDDYKRLVEKHIRDIRIKDCKFDYYSDLNKILEMTQYLVFLFRYWLHLFQFVSRCSNNIIIVEGADRIGKSTTISAACEELNTDKYENLFVSNVAVFPSERITKDIRLGKYASAELSKNLIMLTDIYSRTDVLLEDLFTEANILIIDRFILSNYIYASINLKKYKSSLDNYYMMLQAQYDIKNVRYEYNYHDLLAFFFIVHIVFYYDLEEERIKGVQTPTPIERLDRRDPLISYIDANTWININESYKKFIDGTLFDKNTRIHPFVNESKVIPIKYREGSDEASYIRDNVQYLIEKFREAADQDTNNFVDLVDNKRVISRRI